MSCDLAIQLRGITVSSFLTMSSGRPAALWSKSNGGKKNLKGRPLAGMNGDLTQVDISNRQAQSALL